MAAAQASAFALNMPADTPSAETVVRSIGMSLTMFFVPPSGASG